VFVSRDEAGFGRCATVQHAGASIAVTIVDAKVAVEDVIGLVDKAHNALARYGEVFNEARDLEARQCMLEEPLYFTDEERKALHVDEELLESCKRALKPAQSVASSITCDVITESMRGIGRKIAISHAILPNVVGLLNGAPGPIRAVDHDLQASGIHSIVTFAGGDLGIVSHSPMDMANVTSSFSRHVDARMVFCVSLGCDEPNVHISQQDGKLLVCVRGVPVSHVAYVAELACARQYRPDLIDKDFAAAYELRDIIQDACSLDTLQSIREIRSRREAASKIISRAVTANLSTIKARLWHPSGRLAQRLVNS
jgi:hypothetical protein